MIGYDTRTIAASAIASRSGRPAIATLHDCPDVRLVLFRIEPGESVPPHTNASSVVLTVLEGSGVFVGPEAEVPVSVGRVVVYEPTELHGMRATSERLVVLAAIAPRPGSR